MIQSVSITSTAFEDFAEACFLVSASQKKKKKINAEAIKFLGLLKKIRLRK